MPTPADLRERRSTSEHAPLDDALIATVAEAHRLAVATRNARHVEPLGVPLVAPWAAWA